MLHNIRVDIQLNPDQSMDELDRRLALLMSIEHPYRHLAIAPDLIIQHAYPLVGNEAAIGVDYRNLPDQYSAIQTAIRERVPVLAGPVNLVQGGTGMIIRMAIFTGPDDRQLWGVLAGVIELEHLLNMTALNELSNDYRLALTGIDGDPSDMSVFWGDLSLPTRNPVTTTITLPTGSWRLMALPKQAWTNPLRFYLLTILGIIGASMFSATVYWILRLQLLREEAMRAQAHVAQHDPLTGLPNRNYLSQILHGTIAEAAKTHARLGVLCMDLDEFKQINISLGHATGDQLIRAIAKRLKDALGDQHLLAYLGADEFAVVVGPILDRTELEKAARLLVNTLTQPIHLNQQELNISASVGIALYPEDGENDIDLIKHADRAMYAAKAAGRNTFHFYSSEMQREADSYVQLHNEILKGIEREEFILAYQPIMDARNGRYSKCEALIRWQHPERGLVPPIHFIPVAERTGAIRALGDWVLSQALRDLAILQKQGFIVQMSINRSSHEFNSPDVAKQWLATIAAHGTETRDIIFEITESLFMDNLIVQQQNIRELHDAGIGFAIDDFGTGYSALNYLSRYPLELIKIDKSFITPLQTEVPSDALAAVLINMARALDLSAVAEGVETPEQFNALKQLQCDYLQGYYLSRPLTLEALIDFLSVHASH